MAALQTLAIPDGLRLVPRSVAHFKGPVLRIAVPESLAGKGFNQRAGSMEA